MNFRNSQPNYLCLCTILGLLLLACSKQKSAISVRVSVSDANTSRVWRNGVDTNGRMWILGVRAGVSVSQAWDKPANQSLSDNKTVLLAGGFNDIQISDNLKRSLVIEDAVSRGDSNANDAHITKVKVSYIDVNGKRVEDNIGTQAVGAEFSKEYQIPRGRTITVTANAAQTGATKHLAQQLLALLNEGIQGKKGESRQGSKAQDILTANAGKRTEDAKVRLKVEILQNGVVIAGKEVESTAQVQATGVALVPTEK